jgi:hypothetical protein
MKKNLYFLLISLTTLMLSVSLPAHSEPDDIPVVDGKVVFSEYLRSNLVKSEIRSRILDYIKYELRPFGGEMLRDNDSKTICNIMDYVVVSALGLSVHAVYMNYVLYFEYTDSLCLMRVRDIQFMEKEDYEKKQQFGQDSEYLNQRTDSVYFPVYTAKEIFIDHQYSAPFYPRASQKVTAAALSRINALFDDVNYLLVAPEKQHKERWKHEK